MPNESKTASRRTVVVKKYENRRLYDTTNSRYVNLDEVAQMVRDGYDVQVVDAVSGEDLTRVVLTQIIADHAKAPDSVFPLDVLRQMVMASGRATQENTLKYMKAVFDVYQNAFRAMAPPINPFEFMSRSRPTPEPAREAPLGARSGEADPRDQQTSEDNELRRRVEELEGLVARLSKRKVRHKSTRRAKTS